MPPADPRHTASMAGAMDLSALKARATAPPPPPGSGPAGAPGPARGPVPPRAAGGYTGPVVVDVTEETFQAEVIDRSLQVPVVIDLWATWCGPCTQLSPVLERLAGEGRGAWVLAKIDVDANPRIAQALRVQGIPAVKAVAQGQLVAEFTGAIPEAEVTQFINALLEAAASMPAPPPGPGEDPAATPEPPEDPRILAAEDALESGDLEGAAATYRQILAAEPAHPFAADALRQVELMLRVTAAGPDPVADADAAPDDLAKQLLAADVLTAVGQVDEAFSRLLTIVRAGPGASRDTARKHLVELFAVVGDDDPRVPTARRNLTNALF